MPNTEAVDIIRNHYPVYRLPCIEGQSICLFYDEKMTFPVRFLMVTMVF